MSKHPGWKRTTQVKLIAELQGFWPKTCGTCTTVPLERSSRRRVSAA
jgi:hypothetical protein